MAPLARLIPRAKIAAAAEAEVVSAALAPVFSKQISAAMHDKVALLALFSMLWQFDRSGVCEDYERAHDRKGARAQRGKAATRALEALATSWRVCHSQGAHCADRLGIKIGNKLEKLHSCPFGGVIQSSSHQETAIWATLEQC